jgi:ABC-2 type transport system ATP-binding protein
MMTEIAIKAENISKWYGWVQGCSEINWEVPAGSVVGLLGPNGAGKSTLMRMLVGLARPSRGTMRVFGADPFDSVEVRARIGYCPEHENVYPELTALEFVTAMARLSGVPKPTPAAKDALKVMGLEKAMHRRVKGFSKGMRQRTKLATCLLHDPDLLVLDEPLTGIDPVARTAIIKSIKELAERGKTIVVSSHVLYEIEALTEDIMVVHQGQVLAEGNMYGIRELIDAHPHSIRVECDDPRSLAQHLAAGEHILGLRFESDTVIVHTADPDRCYDLIANTSLDRGIAIGSLTSPDNNLAAVFDYLTERSS